MTEPNCLHTKRVRAMEIEQGTPSAKTLWAERCVQCSTAFLYTLDTLTICHPDGTTEVTAHDGGPLAESDIKPPHSGMSL